MPDPNDMSIRFFVTNLSDLPELSEYEWQLNGQPEPWCGPEYFIDAIPFLTLIITEGECRIACRAPNIPGGGSEWSELVFNASEMNLE